MGCANEPLALEENDELLATRTFELLSETYIGKDCSRKMWLALEEKGICRSTDESTQPSVQDIISYFRSADDADDRHTDESVFQDLRVR